MATASASPPKTLYRVLFHQQGKLYEVYARGIFQSELYGFIEIEDFVFGERGSAVVDPTEERLKKEFQNVGRVFIPMHAVVRIDEVEKGGAAKIRELGEAESKVSYLPLPPMPPVNRND